MANNVTRMVGEKPLVIFSKSDCHMCYAIKTLMLGFGANVVVYEIDKILNGPQLERELVDLGCRPTVPAVYIGQELVGGPDEIMSLHLQGKLVNLLKKAKALWV